MVIFYYLGYIQGFLIETLRNDHENDVDPKSFQGLISIEEADNPVHSIVQKVYKVINYKKCT